MRRILKRLRRSVGVEELDLTEYSDRLFLPPSEYTGASFGTLTWSDGGRNVSLMATNIFQGVDSGVTPLSLERGQRLPKYGRKQAQFLSLPIWWSSRRFLTSPGAMSKSLSNASLQTEIMAEES